MTWAGTIVNYLIANWGAGVIPPLNRVHFDEGWYDGKAGQGLDAQIVVSDAIRPVGQRFTGGGTLYSRNYPRFSVNCWYREPRGYLGTLNLGSINAMRDEVLRIVQTGWRSIFSGYSRICSPLDEGVPLHEVDVTPRIMRYEITLMATKDL